MIGQLTIQAGIVQLWRRRRWYIVSGGSRWYERRQTVTKLVACASIKRFVGSRKRSYSPCHTWCSVSAFRLVVFSTSPVAHYARAAACEMTDHADDRRKETESKRKSRARRVADVEKIGNPDRNDVCRNTVCGIGLNVVYKSIVRT